MYNSALTGTGQAFRLEEIQGNTGESIINRTEKNVIPSDKG